MKILVIEYFDGCSPERLDRQEFWKRQVVTHQNQIQIVLCPQGKGEGDFLGEPDGKPFDLESFDVVFIHESDMQYSEGKDYIELAKAEFRPFVCYSGGAKAVNAPKIEQCQIDLMPLDKLRARVSSFFEKLGKDGAVNPDAFYLLADIHPRIQAALKLLYLFLPLDVELQLHHDSLYPEKCREEARKLENHLGEIFRLTGQIAELEIGADEIKAQGGVVPTVSPGDEINLLRNLFAHTARIAQVGNDKNQLLSVFGYDQGPPSPQNQLAPTLAEGGFHRTYEKLRDRLLALAATDDRYGS